MKKLAALAFAMPLAFGLCVLANDASAAPASSGALGVIMNSEALNGVTGETATDGLVEQARYYYRRRYYRRPYYRYRYYRPYRYYRRSYYRPYNYRYYRGYRY
jgi:hypothetical protein